MTPKYRIWITGSRNNNFLQSLKPRIRVDDIVIQNNQNVGGLLLLGGYAKKALLNVSQLSFPVDSQSLKNIFLPERFALINSEQGFLLNDNEWNALRAIIVQKNPDLKAVIDSLEAKQLQKAILTQKEALVYDAVFSPLQAFFGKNLPEELRDSLEAWRRRLLRENDDDVILEIIPDLKAHNPDNFRNPGDIQDPHHSEISQLFGDKFQEEESIRHDFNRVVP